MTSTDLHYLELLEVGRLIQGQQLSSEEVTRSLLERIDHLEPQLHSFATRLADSALTAARTADQEIARGVARGPLHGVPMAVKDLLWVAGAPAAHGMTIHQNHIPTEDATVVRRLREAGAVLLGKLQQTEGAFGAHHPRITAPVNPWGSDLWPGVSSSGSGVATAAGLCFGSLGTDTGGSIRFPAAANGVTGLKPTWGRVSRHGAFELAASMDHIGPIARSSADVGAILAAIAGADPLDPTASQRPVADYLTLMSRGLSGLRVGLDPAWALEPADAATQATLRSVVDLLEDLGASMREIRFPDSDQIARDWAPLCGVETAVAHHDTFPQRRDEYGPVLAALIDGGLAMSATDYQLMQRRRADFSGRVQALFQEVDLLIAPAMIYAAPTLQQITEANRDKATHAARLRYTAPFDMSGHPTLTLPGGATGEGVPVAFQFIAPRFGEALLVQAGWAYQRVTSWHQRHPAL